MTPMAVTRRGTMERSNGILFYATSVAVVALSISITSSFFLPVTDAFVVPISFSSWSPVADTSSSSSFRLFMSLMEKKKEPKKQSRSSNSSDESKKDIKGDESGSGDNEEEEIYGAKFFGGSAVKEELFDETLEESVIAAAAAKDDDAQLYKRFEDSSAFPDDDARSFAKGLQAAANDALFEVDGDTSSDTAIVRYSPNLKWVTPFSRDKSSKTPLDELTHTLKFYKRVDLAIISAQSKSSASAAVKEMEIRWEISVQWPNVWESRVLLTGTSTLTVDITKTENDDATTKTVMTILSQSDTLDNGGKDGKDIVKAINHQLQPRFWDLYHIGMTPSAEIMPRLPPSIEKKKGLFSSYELFEMPPRIVIQPTIVDTGGRKMREAQAVPNHAFASIIKTSGPKTQRYVTTSPVEVSIRRRSNDAGGGSLISWNIPVPPEFVSYSDTMKLSSPDDGDEDEDDLEKEPTCQFVYQPRRLVATMKYGGNPQDEAVTEIRKKLYEEVVVRDGWKPKFEDDEKSRPRFFFLQNDAKACFTAEGGLGMAVYDWRPKSVDANEVGIELEL